MKTVDLVNRKKCILQLLHGTVSLTDNLCEFFDRHVEQKLTVFTIHQM